MQRVLVPIACRSVETKEGLGHNEHAHYVHCIWSAIMLIQERPALVELLDMRTPEVIPIRGFFNLVLHVPPHDLAAARPPLILGAQGDGRVLGFRLDTGTHAQGRL